MLFFVSVIIEIFSTTFLTVAVFLFVLKWKPKGWKSVAYIGKRYSTWLYVLHPIFDDRVLNVVIKNIGIYEQYQYIAPFVVFAITLAFLIVIDRAHGLIKKEKDQS